MARSRIYSKDNLPKKLPLTKQMLNLSNKVIGRLKVLYYIGALTTDGAHWLCKCSCGNYVAVSRKSLTRKDKPTQSCGCLSREAASRTHRKDLTNKVFNLLTAVEPIESDKSGHMRWKCICRCGNHTFVTSNNLQSRNVRSCGCLRNGFEEEQIAELLLKFNFKFKRNYSFNNLFAHEGHLLRFDFAIFNEDELIALIEFQGENDFYNLFDSASRREIKKEYCARNNIKLFYVSYYSNIENEINKIIGELSQ